VSPHIATRSDGLHKRCSVKDMQQWTVCRDQTFSSTAVVPLRISLSNNVQVVSSSGASDLRYAQFDFRQGHPTILRFFSAPPGKCWDGNSVRPWHFPSTTFPMFYSFIILPSVQFSLATNSVVEENHTLCCKGCIKNSFPPQLIKQWNVSVVWVLVRHETSMLRTFCYIIY
jgi:hypothetical protein